MNKIVMNRLKQEYSQLETNLEKHQFAIKHVGYYHLGEFLQYMEGVGF